MFNRFIGKNKVTKGRIPQSLLFDWNKNYGHKLSTPIKFTTLKIKKKQVSVDQYNKPIYKQISCSLYSSDDTLYNIDSNFINVITIINKSHYCLIKNKEGLSIMKKLKLIQKTMDNTM